MLWAYGVTTVGTRGQFLDRTLDSMAAAGFGAPRVFFDVGLGGFGNWSRAAWTLWVAEPRAERYAIFQDDILVCKNLREYLERWYPAQGYLNLMTMQWNTPEDCGLAKETRGWYPARVPGGKGAQALVFDRDALGMLFQQPHYINHPHAVRHPDRNIDGTIIDALSPVGWTEYVHTPSLVQHVGTTSAIGNAWKGAAPNFSEDYDPCSETALRRH